MLSIPKKTLEPRAAIPAGFVQVIFQGFKPKLSKPKEGKTQSVNFNPQLRIVNDARTDATGKSLNGQPVFDNLNWNFTPGIVDFFHAFGVELIENGDQLDIPGTWSGDTQSPNPELWGTYSGPLDGKTATIELVETSYQGKPQMKIKRYLCILGDTCNMKHSDNLVSR
jgi:hypothetical protein